MPPAIKKVVVDALQLPAELSGLGRQVQTVGKELHDLPPELELEVRCPRNVRPLLEPMFPPATRFRTPLASNRPRWLRIMLQHVLAPMLDSRSSLLLCLGDQAPIWGRARVLLVVNDVRRLLSADSSGFFERLYYRAMVPLAVRHASLVATISEFSRREMSHALGPGVEPVVVAQRPPVPPPSPRGSEDSLLVVGALRSYKSADTVVEALSMLDAPGRPRVRFAGSRHRIGTDLERLAASLGVGASVEVLGWVSEEELEGLYASAFATVHPSRYEGYGLAVVESMSHGVPVLASDIPAHREVAEAAALYFPPGDAGALASAIGSVLASADVRDRLAAAGLERARRLRGAVPSWRDVVLQAIAGTLTDDERERSD